MAKSIENPRSIKATEFEANCLELVDEVVENDAVIIITKRGMPVAKLTRMNDVPKTDRPKSFYGIDRGRIKITGDIVSPVDVEWEAISNPDRVLNPC